MRPRPRHRGDQASYEAGITDEFIKPVVIVGADRQPIGPIRDGDSVVFFNFRADRARQLTRAIALDDFDGFERPHRPAVELVMMTVYDRTFPLPAVFTPQSFTGNFADVLAARGRTNLRLAETEKYAHVTYFFNCGREEAYPAETGSSSRQKVATYDLKRDERARSRRARRRRGRAAARRHHLQLRQCRHGGPYGTSVMRRSRRSRRSTAASAASWRPRPGRRHDHRHRRP